MNNADEIRKQLQAAKDALLSEVMTRSDKGAFTPMINKMVGDVRDLERQLIEMERVILKPVPDFDSLSLGQKYFVSCNKGGENEIAYDLFGREVKRKRCVIVDKGTQIFIPVGESND